VRTVELEEELKVATPKGILDIFDACGEAFTFPMLDNGYVYLAAGRMSVFALPPDWALVFEIFGFSPRAGLPDTSIVTFSNVLRNRDAPSQYVSQEAYDAYIRNNPANDFRAILPIEEGDWQDSDDAECVSPTAATLVLRGQQVVLPSLADYERLGIELSSPPSVQVFELCRALGMLYREPVLATDAERRVSVPDSLPKLLVLDEWNHPDLASGDTPSGSGTFQQLARVLATGDPGLYNPTCPPSSHWRNWPDGGTL
jgi:hypothetical protein